MTIDEFHTAGYLQHNHCRQAHLASLGLDLERKTVLELGAGVGDHSTFWLKRGCRVTCVEARTENVERLREAQPEVKVIQCDLDRPELPVDTYDVVYAYGILYHLKDPAGALRRWAQVCKGLLLLETCVSPESGPAIYLMQEKIENATASFNGTGCRPTRQWILDELRKWFRHVYLPLSQPRHEEFPLDWGHVRGNGLVRAVFVASRTELENPVLTEILPWMQFWHAEAE
jgi:SAM-dependent methyltransferase